MTLPSCLCSSVPVSSYACLWMAGYETGHTLPSSSSWEIGSDRVRGGKIERGEITSNLHTKIQRHWVKKQMLWSSWFGWRASDNSVHRAEGVWKMAWKIKGLFFTDGCKWNIVSWFIRDSRQVRPSLLQACSHCVHGVEGCYVIVFWNNSYSDSLKLNMGRRFSENLVIVCQKSFFIVLSYFLFYSCI